MLQMILLYLPAFLVAFFVATLGLALTGSLAKKYPVARRMGGASVIAGSVLAILLDRSLIMTAPIEGILFGALAIFVFGILDDIADLSWQKQLVFQFGLGIIVFVAGIRILSVPLPTGETIFLDALSFGSILGFFLLSGWIALIINALNWTDGSDGLLPSISGISFFVIFLLSQKPEVFQPPVGILSLAFVGAMTALLVWNFPPARLLAGTSGSFFAGFALASLAALSGTKIATALLALSLPVADALWVGFERIRSGASPFHGRDRRHLHERLRARGWSDRRILLAYVCFTSMVAFVALRTNASEKTIAFVVIFPAILLFLSRLGKHLSIFPRRPFSKKAGVMLLVGGLMTGILFKAYESSRPKETSLEINGTIFQIEVAKTQEERERGLGQRDSLCAECGMLFVFDRPARYGIWMKDMSFAIDIVWIRDGRVVAVESDVSERHPSKVYEPDEAADLILELNAGTTRLNGIREGSIVRFPEKKFL